VERPGSDGAQVEALIAGQALNRVRVRPVAFAEAVDGGCLRNALAYARAVGGTVVLGRHHATDAGVSCCHAWVMVDGRHVDPTPMPLFGWYEGVVGAVAPGVTMFGRVIPPD
jgi:hypothetical protein